MDIDIELAILQPDSQRQRQKFNAVQQLLCDDYKCNNHRDENQK